MIIDGIGANTAGGFASLLKLFAAIGYEARVLLVACRSDTAESRNELRAEQNGLLIDPQLLASLHASVAKHFEEWKDLPAMLQEYRTD
jgi:hypothetical protein